MRRDREKESRETELGISFGYQRFLNVSLFLNKTINNINLVPTFE